MLKKSLWLLPFASFIGGYLFITFFLGSADIAMPSLLGKSLPEAFSVLAPHSISARLLAYKPDSDLPDGTIVGQIPAPGKKIKPRQTALLTLSQKPSQITAPNLIGASKDAIVSHNEQDALTIKIYDVESLQPSGTCIAQSPAPLEPLEKNDLITYCARQTKKPLIWPSFINQPLDHVIEFLGKYDIEPQITSLSTAPSPEPLHVVDQRPLAGTIIFTDLSTPPIVQLCVQ